MASPGYGYGIVAMAAFWLWRATIPIFGPGLSDGVI